MATLHEMYLKEKEREARNPPPSPLIFLPHQLFVAAIKAQSFRGYMLVDTATGERDFSSFGKYADEYKAKWDRYDEIARQQSEVEK